MCCPFHWDRGGRLEPPPVAAGVLDGSGGLLAAGTTPGSKLAVAPGGSGDTIVADGSDSVVMGKGGVVPPMGANEDPFPFLCGKKKMVAAVAGTIGSDSVAAGASLPNGCSKEVMEAAAVADVLDAAPRASPRLANVAGDRVLDRAKKRTAWKNLEDNKGKSFLSYKDSCLMSSFSNLGVLLDHNGDKSSVSLNNFRRLEQERLCLASSCVENDVPNESCTEDEEENFEFENLTLGHLCGDLMEEVMDEEDDQLSCDFQTVFKKNKARGKNKKAKFKVVRKNNKGLK